MNEIKNWRYAKNGVVFHVRIERNQIASFWHFEAWDEGNPTEANDFLATAGLARFKIAERTFERLGSETDDDLKRKQNEFEREVFDFVNQMKEGEQ